MSAPGTPRVSAGTVPRTPPVVPSAPTPVEARSAVLAGALDRLGRRAQTVENFWATTGHRSPIVEPDPGDATRRIVTFLWRDADADHVYIGINKVTHGLDQGAMTRVPGTDIWYRTVALDARWRGSYGLVPLDDATWRALLEEGTRPALRRLRARYRPDPRNPLTEPAHTGETLSVARLDRAPEQPWIRTPHNGDAPAPTTPEPVEGPGGRTLWVVPPADDGLPHHPQAPVLLVLDGAVWLRRRHVTDTVAAQAAAGLIRPPVIVYVDNGEPERRMAELSVDSGTAAELAGRIVPWVRDRHAVSADPADVVVVGQSLGGLTALKTAFDHPEVVGAAIAQSSSLWQENMLERARAAQPGRPRLWIEVGLAESILLDDHRRLHRELRDRGAAEVVGYTEFVGGHDSACWRGGIGDGLLALLGGR